MNQAIPTEESRTKHSRKRRKRKFVKPEIQRSWIMMTMLTIGVTVVAQAILIVHMLTRIASTVPNDGEAVLALLPQYLALCLGLTVLFLAPFFVLVAVLMSFRIAGPVYRLEAYLRQVIEGEKPPDCRLRDGDQLMVLCELVNTAPAPLRRASADDRGAENPPENERVDAA